jgi:NAD(P)-dependent dehydrogenase (short-subunit alcohol dehydrogenase family)
MLEIRLDSAVAKKIIASSGRLISIMQCRSWNYGTIGRNTFRRDQNNFETNLFGPIEVMKAALPQMRTQKIRFDY